MPTKPLVTQQHEACQNSCGIPSEDTATVTGDDPEKWRDEAVSLVARLDLCWYGFSDHGALLLGSSGLRRG